MLRNREWAGWLLSSLLLTFAAASCGYVWISPAAGLLTLATGLALSALTLFFTHRRYRSIQELSHDLRSIRAGCYTLDIRDHREGELSILQSEIYKLTLMLSEQAELLRRDKAYLADSLSDISHQLKTPLTSMLVMVDLLGDPKLQEDNRRTFLRSIRNQLERIEWLVTALLKLSKIDAGAVRFKREPCRVQAVLDKASAPLLLPMEVKEQTLTIEGNPEAMFIGDHNWTVEALLNVLKNATEHSGAGGRIEVSFDENPLYTEILISDNGNGIDPVDLPHVFERFYKGKSSSADSVGIGLAMARSILHHQQADLSVKSELGQGTTFTVRFHKPM
ncbi:HAMP domain-containing sensor histidine kinase [Gorillibacterium sp. CAU 1737]|uniref:sensor histidine kinase n=1 Tax=Gorillibacterium sp. CAU 1737 TaxID=3140362 RepID=UPI0032611121